jgi:hypothetical protein
LEQKPRAAAEATGDDSILDVAVMEPKGSAGAAVTGAAIGGVVGSGATDFSGWGSSLGMAGCVIAGRAAMGMSEHLPPYICVAVTPDNVHLPGMTTNFSHKHMTLLGQIARDTLGVEVHQRGTVRTVVLEDLDSNVEFPREVKRLNCYHGNAVVELSMMSEEYHDEEPSDEEVEAANV